MNCKNKTSAKDYDQRSAMSNQKDNQIHIVVIFSNHGSAKYLFFGKCFKKNCGIFSQISFVFKSTIIPVNNGK